MPRSSYRDRIKAARAALSDRGQAPAGVIPEPIARSWDRCVGVGLSVELRPQLEPLASQALKSLKEQNSRLLLQALPEMEVLRSQLNGTHSMVILTDAGGTILHATGDNDFVGKAQQVALLPGVSWREENTGTNAIGTSLVERQPVFVAGAEHYFEQNAFLNCSAAPIFNPHGAVIGVLDVSGDHRQPQAHTLALVRMSAQMIENRLFNDEFSGNVILRFHARPEFIGTLWEAIAAFAPDGSLLALNKSAMGMLELAPGATAGASFAELFDCPLEAFLGASRQRLPQSTPLRAAGGRQFHARMEAGFALRPVTKSRPPQAETVRRAGEAGQTGPLDSLDTGDQQMRRVIAQVKKIAQHDIPILIEGETGTGKELLARALHAAAGRKGPFVAINCAAIPEGLIESELFGYEDGAFTGARRSGVPGKVLQANGGTLFLDEIGDMPLQLQARLLRVLQEREIVPLGSAKGIPVDIAVVSATNHSLRDCIAHGRFRQDLYYRLSGLRVSLPALRERGDLEQLAALLIEQEHGCPLNLHPQVLALLRRHRWPGNIRELRNVLRTALAFVEDAGEILLEHLPPDFLDEAGAAAAVGTPAAGRAATGIAAAEAELIRSAMLAHAGNVTRAAQQLGIGRATLYRKLKRLRLA